jgi:hypothetical protein
MTLRALAPAALLALAAVPARADDPPTVEHQPFSCTVAGKPMQLCATIADDQSVAAARIYFRRKDEDFYSFVDMTFGGLNYCGTVPAPREGKVKAIEYYVQAVDGAFQPARTSTQVLLVQAEGACEFPPLETDPKRAAAIRVHATNAKQGSKLDDAFAAAGVTFVPVSRR